MSSLLGEPDPIAGLRNGFQPDTALWRASGGLDTPPSGHDFPLPGCGCWAGRDRPCPRALRTSVISESFQIFQNGTVVTSNSSFIHPLTTEPTCVDAPLFWALGWPELTGLLSLSTGGSGGRAGIWTSKQKTTASTTLGRMWGCRGRREHFILLRQRGLPGASDIWREDLKEAKKG